MAPNSQGLLQGGNVTIEQFSDNAFRALNISTTTRTDMAIVEGDLERNIEQSKDDALSSPQCWKERISDHDNLGPLSYIMNHHKKPRDVAMPTYAPTIKYRKKSHLSTIPSVDFRGGFLMMS